MLEYDIFDKDGRDLGCDWYLSQDGCNVICVEYGYGDYDIAVQSFPASNFTIKLRKYEQND